MLIVKNYIVNILQVSRLSRCHPVKSGRAINNLLTITDLTTSQPTPSQYVLETVKKKKKNCLREQKQYRSVSARGNE